MLSESLKKFDDLYSEYIRLAVDLHNYRRSFKENAGYRTCQGVKRTGRRMNDVLRQIQKLARQIYLENKKANPKKRGPKGKKNGHNNSTITKTI